MSVVALNQFTRLSPNEREALLDSLWAEEAALKLEVGPDEKDSMGH